MHIGQIFNPYALFTGALVPEALCRCRSLRPGAKICYGRLARYGGQDGDCYPSVPALAIEIGVSTRQCRSYLRKLEEEKFIRRVSRGNGHAKRYEFLCIRSSRELNHGRILPPYPGSKLPGYPGKILPKTPAQSFRQKRVIEEITALPGF